jgi:hypothetical protein
MLRGSRFKASGSPAECKTGKEMKLFWRQVNYELSHGRDATLILAIIAGFVAWIITQLLRSVFG